MSHNYYSKLKFNKPSYQQFKQYLQKISKNNNFNFSKNNTNFLPQISPKKVHHITPI